MSAETKIQIDLNQDAPCRVAFEMANYPIGGTEKSGEEFRKEFLTCTHNAWSIRKG